MSVISTVSTCGLPSIGHRLAVDIIQGSIPTDHPVAVEASVEPRTGLGDARNDWKVRLRCGPQRGGHEREHTVQAIKGDVNAVEEHRRR